MRWRCASVRNPVSSVLVLMSCAEILRWTKDWTVSLNLRIDVTRKSGTAARLGQQRRLSRPLTVYRLAFGQPHQEDLLEYLHSLLGTDTAAEDLTELQIRLEP
jgi:hypothetical protein